MHPLSAHLLLLDIICRFDYLTWNVFEKAFWDWGRHHEWQGAHAEYLQTGIIPPEVVDFCERVRTGKRHYWDEQQAGAAIP